MKQTTPKQMGLGRLTTRFEGDPMKQTMAKQMGLSRLTTRFEGDPTKQTTTRKETGGEVYDDFCNFRKVLDEMVASFCTSLTLR
ncbi:hypothetical protein Patl1_24084 [Pistacia atlantica]|uniref:Uncharacterized protein n=1 Tax=Pistacia atlantica TaxID=434234 RepID=A0ACC0ZWT7_9ROSI|nr:hypothetical protein Patl1_24084 [Pistacia atlantica]